MTEKWKWIITNVNVKEGCMMQIPEELDITSLPESFEFRRKMWFFIDENKQVKFLPGLLTRYDDLAEEAGRMFRREVGDIYRPNQNFSDHADKIFNPIQEATTIPPELQDHVGKAKKIIDSVNAGKTMKFPGILKK